MAASEKLPSVNVALKANGSLAMPSNGTFAFLVHSQDTLNNNLPPSIDNRPLARQKRRRTSPEDHAILEQEYQQNPKPDKAARIVIVSRVALGEKEVQIWFQNRRQIARRRSCPLPPNGTASYSVSSQETFGNATSSDIISDGGTQRPVSSSQSSMHSIISNEDATKFSGTSTATAPTNVLGDSPRMAKLETIALNCPARGGPNTSSQRNGGNKHVVQSTTTSASVLKPETGTDPLVSFAGISRATAISAPTRTTTEPVQGHQFERNSSGIRLSMSLDGKAEVKTEATPSPPRSQPLPLCDQPFLRPTTLQRSQSAIAPHERSSLEDDSIPLFPRRVRPGRSRDARTWEFYCDPEAQDALTAQAEREQSGSAISAIGLIRSQSNNVMTPNNNKRNAQASKHESMKRLKGSSEESSKRKLARTTSSVARLETGRRHDDLEARKEKHAKSSSQPTRIVSPSGDSDKENWEPGTQTGVIRRLGNPKSQKRRPILEENSHTSVQSSHSDTSTTKSHGHFSRIIDELGDEENITVGEDEEEASSMGATSPPRKDEDLDCVQGLLSLSQGAWK